MDRKSRITKMIFRFQLINISLGGSIDFTEVKSLFLHDLLINP